MIHPKLEQVPRFVGACSLFLLLSVPLASKPVMTGYHEVLGTDVGHYRYRDGKLAYQAQVGTLELLREPVVGVLAFRGRNLLRLSKVRIRTQDSPFEPLLSSLGGSGQKVEMLDLAVVFEGETSVHLRATSALFLGEQVLLRDALLEREDGSTQRSKKALLDPSRRKLTLDSGRVVKVGP